MSHYFTNDYSKSNERMIETKIGGQGFRFYVDDNVFSKSNLDFGTRSLLENIEIDTISGSVLDFGCGYGPIGIYLAKNTDSFVDMIDVNERSLNLASKNLELNGVKANVFFSDIYSGVSKKYDFIVTNPPIRVGKKILYEILFGAKKYLTEKGVLWLVINKDQGAKSLMRDLEKEYKVTLVKKNKGFYIIKAEVA